MAEGKKTGAQKHQIKFSGLLNAGVVDTPNNAPTLDLPSSIAADDDGGLPVLGEKTSEVAPLSNEQNAATALPPVAVEETAIKAKWELVSATEPPRKIPLSLIDDSPYQPRIEYDDSEIDHLSHSLAAAGIEEPIKVRLLQSGRFERITGHRRCRAAHNIGWTEIDAYIIVATDQEAKLAVRVSNIGQVKLSDYELAKMYRESLDDGVAKGQAMVANLFSTTQGLVSRCLGMLKLPQYCIDLMESRPRLITVNCADSIRQLLDKYPKEGDLIERAVLRLNNPDVEQTSVKPWFQQMYKQKYAVGKLHNDPVLTDKFGTPLMVVKWEGDGLKLVSKSKHITPEMIKEIVMGPLTNFTHDYVAPKPESDKDASENLS